MSMSLYDDALVTHLRSLTGDDRISIVPPSEAIKFLAHLDKDKTKFPAIVLSRGPIGLTSVRNQYVALKGQTASYNPEDNTVTKAKLVPLRMEWTIDVFAVDRYSCDEIVRELIFYFIENPRFQVTVPYGLNIPQNFDIFLEETIEDNSDLIEFPNTGELFRETIAIYTENAHLYSSRRQYLTRVNSDVTDKD